MAQSATHPVAVTCIPFCCLGSHLKRHLIRPQFDSRNHHRALPLAGKILQEIREHTYSAYAGHAHTCSTLTFALYMIIPVCISCTVDAFKRYCQKNHFWGNNKGPYTSWTSAVIIHLLFICSTPTNTSWFSRVHRKPGRRSLAKRCT